MAAPYPQVVLFGDSLFQGSVEVQDGFSFSAAIQNHCARRYDVINRGFSGYNTSQAVKMLEQVFPKPTAGGPQLKYLLILLGANDASIPRSDENQAVPLEQYTRNLTHIVTHPHIAAHSSHKVLVITPPPVDEIRTAEVDFAQRGHNTHSSVRQAAYSQAARDVAAAAAAAGGNVKVVDLQKALMEYAVARTPGWEEKEGVLLGSVESGERGYLRELLPDGLHMNGEAYRVLWELVKGEIEVPNEGNEGYVFREWKQAEWL
ncbi:unnamed protein product [Discula destructiva]